jgi:hypothetical protein
MRLVLLNCYLLEVEELEATQLPEAVEVGAVFTM